MDQISIAVDRKAIDDRLKKLLDKGSNLAPAMKSCAAIMLSSVQQNFREEGRPYKWRPWAPATVKQRKKEGKYPGTILQKSQAGLLQSIQAVSDSTSAAVGTNKLFPNSDKSAGAIHNFGGQAGRGLQVTIPKREFLMLQNEDEQDILDTVEKHVMS
jgi:phage virion morphogenesis protein